MSKANRGFASMDRERQRAIASQGGKKAHAYGTAHQWTTEEAREAGRKGGLATARKKVNPVSPIQVEETNIAGTIVAFLVFVLWASLASAQSMPTYELPRGTFGPTGDNEVRIVSTIDDPAAYRGGIREDALRGVNLLKVSGNLTRSDGIDEEYGAFFVKVRNGKTMGAFSIGARARNGDLFEVMDGDQDRVFFNVPIYAPNMDGTVIRSRNGRVILVAQEDGNLVLYIDGRAYRAVFGLPSGQLW